MKLFTLTKEGWNYSSLRFKSYMQDVLINPDYDLKISGIRKFLHLFLALLITHFFPK